MTQIWTISSTTKRAPPRIRVVPTSNSVCSAEISAQVPELLRVGVRIKPHVRVVDELLLRQPI